MVLSASEAQGEGVFLEVIMTMQAEEGLQTSSPESLGFAGSRGIRLEGCGAGARQSLISVTQFPYSKQGPTHFCPLG